MSTTLHFQYLTFIIIANIYIRIILFPVIMIKYCKIQVNIHTIITVCIRVLIVYLY